MTKQKLQIETNKRIAYAYATEAEQLVGRYAAPNCNMSALYDMVRDGWLRSRETDSAEDLAVYLRKTNELLEQMYWNITTMRKEAN